jgi:hypothetical protein
MSFDTINNHVFSACLAPGAPGRGRPLSNDKGETSSSLDSSTLSQCSGAVIGSIYKTAEEEFHLQSRNPRTTTNRGSSDNPMEGETSTNDEKNDERNDERNDEETATSNEGVSTPPPPEGRPRPRSPPSPELCKVMNRLGLFSDTDDESVVSQETYLVKSAAGDATTAAGAGDATTGDVNTQANPKIPDLTPELQQFMDRHLQDQLAKQKASLFEQLEQQKEALLSEQRAEYRERTKCMVCKSWEGDETSQGITRNVALLPCCKRSMCADCLCLFTTCRNKCKTHHEEFQAYANTARTIVKIMPRFSRDRALKIVTRLAKGKENYDGIHNEVKLIHEALRRILSKIDFNDIEVFGCLDDKLARRDKIGQHADNEKGLIKQGERCHKQIGEARSAFDIIDRGLLQFESATNDIARGNARRVQHAVDVEVQDDAEANEEDAREIALRKEEAEAQTRQEQADRRKRRRGD